MHKNKSSVTTYLQASIDKLESGNFVIGKNNLGRVYVRPNTGDVKHNEYFIRLPEIGELFYRKGTVQRDINNPLTVRGYTKKGNIITDSGVILYSNVFRMMYNQRKTVLVPKSINEIISGRYFHRNAVFNDFGSKIHIRDEDGTIEQTIGTYSAKIHYYIVHPCALIDNMHDIRFEAQRRMSIDSCFSDPITMSQVNYMLKMCNSLTEENLYTIREKRQEIEHLTGNIQNRKSTITNIIIKAQSRCNLDEDYNHGAINRCQCHR